MTDVLDAHYVQGLRWFERGWSGNVYETWMKEKGETPDVLADLAYAHLRAGACEPAATSARKALAAAPRHLYAQVTLGVGLLELGRADEARTVLSHAARACQAVPAMPSNSETATSPAAPTLSRCRRTNLRTR